MSEISVEAYEFYMKSKIDQAAQNCVGHSIGVVTDLELTLYERIQHVDRVDGELVVSYPPVIISDQIPQKFSILEEQKIIHISHLTAMPWESNPRTQLELAQINFGANKPVIAGSLDYFEQRRLNSHKWKAATLEKLLTSALLENPDLIGLVILDDHPEVAKAVIELKNPRIQALVRRMENPPKYYDFTNISDELFFEWETFNAEQIFSLFQQ